MESMRASWRTLVLRSTVLQQMQLALKSYQVLLAGGELVQWRQHAWHYQAAKAGRSRYKPIVSRPAGGT